jgi:ATF/CREB family transcription factor
VAALKCRQRKKQWLQNLQAKVDLYSQENDALTHTAAQLREQNLQLRQILAGHKDCQVTAQQGFTPQNFINLIHNDGAGMYMPQANNTQSMSMMMAGPTAAASVIPRS